MRSSRCLILLSASLAVAACSSGTHSTTSSSSGTTSSTGSTSASSTSATTGSTGASAGSSTGSSGSSTSSSASGSGASSGSSSGSTGTSSGSTGSSTGAGGTSSGSGGSSTGSAEPPEPSFGTARWFATPDPYPYSLAVGDLNGDGRADVVVSDGQVLFVYLGDGTGHLHLRETEQGWAPLSIVIADLTGDGVPDLATDTPYGTYAYVGRGDGTFEAPINNMLNAGTLYSTGVAGGVDLDGDGVPDLVLHELTHLYVLHGSGNGHFTLASTDGTLAPTAVVVTDIDGDSHQDVIVANNNNGHPDIVLELGNGHGQFTKSTLSVCGEKLAAADLDGDGSADLLTTCQQPLSTSVLYGAGQGTFLPALVLDGGVSGASTIAVGDVNGDGVVDAIVGGLSASTMLISGDRSRGVTLGPPVFEQGSQSMALADFDGDGKLDLAAVSGPGIAIVAGAGDGGFPLPPESSISASAIATDPQDIAGLLAASSDGGGIMTLAAADGGGPLVVTSFAPAVPGVVRFVRADVDGDGRPDVIAATHGASPGLLLLTALADGGFASPVVLDASVNLNTLQVVDLDGDGLADLVYDDVNTNEVRVLRGARDGGFAPAEVTALNAVPNGVALGDLNADGRPDLAISTANSTLSTISVRLSLPDGGLAPKRDVPVALPAGPISLADVDHDGELDVIAVSDHPIAALRLPDGGYVVRDPATQPTSGTSFVLEDLDGDGNLDVAATRAYSAGLTIWWGAGDGGFPFADSYVLPPSPALLSGDFNGDGKLDLVALDLTGTLHTFYQR